MTPAAATPSGDPAPSIGPDKGEPSGETVPALEPDTLPNRPLRASDVPGFIPKLIG